MDYPHGFPDHLKFPVDTAFSNSEIEFARLRKQETSKDDGLRHIERYVRSVFFAFAKAACKAVEEGLWSAEQFRRETDKYRDDLAHHVYFDKIFWTATSEELARLKRSVKLQIESMDEWTGIQNELKTALLTVEFVKRSPPPVPVVQPRFDTLEAATRHAEELNKANGKKTRQFREPNPDLLTGLETVNKIRAANALGISTRQVDRYVKDKLLIPVGGFGRKRFKTKDLLKFITKNIAT